MKINAFHFPQIVEGMEFATFSNSCLWVLTYIRIVKSLSCEVDEFKNWGLRMNFPLDSEGRICEESCFSILFIADALAVYGSWSWME